MTTIKPETSKMAKRKTQQRDGTVPHRNEYDDTDSVNAYMELLGHPLKPVVEVIRHTILEVDQRITEGIKWNSPSFYCYGWFAAVNIRAKKGVQVVLHHGAKVRNDSTLSSTIDDASHLLTWPSKDRAVLSFISTEDFQNKRGAFEKIIKQWANYQAHLADLPQTVSTSQ
jgi:hypothetical protein